MLNFFLVTKENKFKINAPRPGASQCFYFIFNFNEFHQIIALANHERFFAVAGSDIHQKV